jgi:hypothetical protein
VAIVPTTSSTSRAAGARRGRTHRPGGRPVLQTKAEAIRGIVADGKDLVGEEQAARERKRSPRVVTVRDVFDHFLEVHRTKLDHKTCRTGTSSG